MLNVTIGKTSLRCKLENIASYQLKISKPPKGGTRQSKEKRYFPVGADALANTRAYVRTYLMSNRLVFAGAEHDYILNHAPTTWPEGPDCIVEECEE